MFIRNQAVALSCLLLLVNFLGSTRGAWAEATFEPGHASFSVSVDGRELTHNIAFRTLMPGEQLSLQSQQPLNISSGGQSLVENTRHWSWKAPTTSGHTTFHLHGPSSSGDILLQVFTLRPASEIKNGKLLGYNIGQYPPPLRNLEVYKAPRGYIEVSSELQQTKVSPHFSLGEFLCKQQSTFPKFLALRPKLLEKLEFLLEEVNSRGIHTPSFVIMSGYRTPFYNRAIGNVANSRHIYGGAADIYIDIDPVDNFMDDINNDGKTDIQDATLLYSIADNYVSKSDKVELRGGVGKYKHNAAHGPFVHVDVRGTRARWGH